MQRSGKKTNILGIGLDNDDEHVRVTRGDNFHLVGGSHDTHENMQEKCIKFNEKLSERGKAMEELEREEFEQLNAENFGKIENCIDEVLAQSGLTAAQIDTVSLTGGTSKIPHIQKLFAVRFGQNKAENRDAFTSVVHGLGSSVPLFV